VELKPGEVVEVRSAAEILATLDHDASAEAMPFMPEMLQHAGKRFTVSRRAEKICDTVSGGPPASRRLRDTVLLEDLRCDGSAHGGCQAGCRLYWKESWLRRVTPGSEPAAPASLNGGPDPVAELEQLANAATRAVRELDGAPTEVFRCQATEALEATEPQNNFDLRQYAREVKSKNVGLLHLLRVGLRGLRVTVGRWLRLVGYRPLPSSGPAVKTRGDLQLKAGDIVEVRSAEEIAPTVDENGKTRGLWFDWEMLPYCGRRFRVQDRVERIIDEGTGEMIEIGSDCLILEGVVCSGECSPGHWLCPREIYPYWREAWLRRVEDAEPSSVGT
jgi:hypothetical protein